jgi:hypothetical protein
MNFFRRHMVDIPRIKFHCATMRLGGTIIFQGSLLNEQPLKIFTRFKDVLKMQSRFLVARRIEIEC